jgi:hypothetical protein
VYEVNDAYKDSLEHPAVWSKVFSRFRRDFNLKNLLEDHDKQRIFRWIHDETAYKWIRSEPGRNNLSLIDGSGTIPDEVKRFDNETREAASILHHVIDKHKNIAPRKERRSNADHVQKSRRTFSVRYLNEQFGEHGEEILDEVVFMVGFFDIAEERWQNAGPNIAYLREHIAAPHSVGVRLPASLKNTNFDLHSHSLGVLGTTGKRGGEVVIEPLAILESGSLPDAIIDHQREERKQREIDLAEERNELLRELRDLHETNQSVEESIEKVQQGVDEVLDDRELEAEEEDVLEKLKELAVIAAAEKGIEWVVTKVVENHPEHVEIIFDAIGL